MTRPPLVIVSGAPATGKSTLARTLAAALRLPLIAKDDIKETLGEALPAASPADSRALGRATYALLFQLTAELLEAGTGLIIESNFYRGQDEERLQPLVDRSSAVLVHCYAPPGLALRRYEERFKSGRRHPVHFDEDTIAFATADNLESWERWFGRPLDLPIPIQVLDTTEGFSAAVEPIVAFVRATMSDSGER